MYILRQTLWRVVFVRSRSRACALGSWPAACCAKNAAADSTEFEAFSTLCCEAVTMSIALPTYVLLH